MNGKKTKRASYVALAAAIWLPGAAPARADAWAASWGRVDAEIIPNGPDAAVRFNDDPLAWYIGAAADARHNHSAPQFDFDCEVFGVDCTNPVGSPDFLDGNVTTTAVLSTDGLGIGSVDRVSVATAYAGGPFIDINDSQDVYAYAERKPAGTSDAEGLGEHDDLFWLEYTGNGEPPATTSVTVRLVGEWNLEGAADFPDESWWASWETLIEVYDLFTEDVLDTDTESHFLSGGEHQFESGSSILELNIEIPFDTSYALRFWQDDETHAEAPEPATLMMVLVGCLAVLRRRARVGR